MVFFNLFARLILLVAAWIATARPEIANDPSRDEKEAEPSLASPSEQASPSGMVPQDVAARTVRVGIGAGYLTGAATGAGLGAAVAYVLSVAGRIRGKPHT
jgi:membrane protein